jgi:hypothetical protein
MPDPTPETPDPVSIATITIVIVGAVGGVGGTCHMRSRGDGPAEELADMLTHLYATVARHGVPDPDAADAATDTGARGG